VVDFAYAVHTDVGNRCVAAKIDRRLTPLRTVLRNGQTIEIITAKGAMPNPSWVNFVRDGESAPARSVLFEESAKERGDRARQRLPRSALAEFTLSLKDVTAESLQAALGELGMKDVDSSTRRSLG